ncbi:hypothetical protein [Stenotrophomonas sp. TWI377]|uniref:hypothetical protein n=1 Tax=Stenotrophomonas sp. TWI377 TaxID=3136775 RepID=UPI003209D3AE
MNGDYFSTLIFATALSGPSSPGWGALAGVFLGWLLKVIGDHFMENSRRKDALASRREVRLDTLRARRIESERANLLSLQPMVTDFMRAGSLCSRAPRSLSAHQLVGEDFERHLEAMRLQASFMLPVRSRLHDRKIAEMLGRLAAAGMNAVQQIDFEDSATSWKSVSPVGRELQEEIGSAIRMLEDEQVQLASIDPE